MAPPVANARAPLLRDVVGQLTALSPARAEYALRVALIVGVTVLTAETYQTLDPAVGAYLVFLLVKPDRVSSILTSLVILVLISLIIAGLLPIAGALDDAPSLRLFAMAGLSLIFVFLASASKLGAPGVMIAMLVVYIIALTPTSPLGELTTRAYLHAWLFVAVPVGATIFVNLLIGPAPRAMLEDLLAQDLRLAARALRGAPDAREQIGARLRAHATEPPKLLELAALEKTSPAQDLAALRQASLASFRLLAIVAAMTEESSARPPEAVATRLAGLFEQMAAIFDEGCMPTEIDFTVDWEADGVHKPLARTALSEIRDCLALFASRDPAAALAQPAVAAEKQGFFKPDAFSNPLHSQFAAKTTLAALACYWSYMILGWSGIHTSLLTCYLVAEATAAESLQRASLRVAGCLVGSALGLATIILLFPSMTSIGSLLLLVAAVAFAAAWIAAGGERVAYAGLQMALAFNIAVLQGYGPGFDMVQIRDRIVGILVGIAAGYLAFGKIWPVSLADRIEANFASLLAAFENLAAARGRPAQTTAGLQAQGLLATLDNDLATVSYEPVSVRPDRIWLRAHRRAMAELDGLFAPLFLRSLHQGEAASEFAARLGRLAGSVVARPAPGPHFIQLGGKALRHLARLDKALRAMRGPQMREGDA